MVESYYLGAMHGTPRLTFCIVIWLTWKSLATTRLALRSFLIASICSLESTRTPRGDLGLLPLRTMSRALSAFVPKNRWSVLMHAGTSHLWQTHKPSGIWP